MKFDPRLKAVVIPQSDFEDIGHYLFDALIEIRKAYNLPMDKYKCSGALAPEDHAQRNIIDIAEKLGIELGARWGNEIDLRDRAA